MISSEGMTEEGSRWPFSHLSSPEAAAFVSLPLATLTCSKKIIKERMYITYVLVWQLNSLLFRIICLRSPSARVIRLSYVHYPNFDMNSGLLTQHDMQRK